MTPAGTGNCWPPGSGWTSESFGYFVVCGVVFVVIDGGGGVVDVVVVVMFMEVL